MNQTQLNLFELEYRNILVDILANGLERNDRTGIGSKSLFSQRLEWSILNNKLPMITGRRIYDKIFFTELLWFINGETNIKRFQDNGISIWDEWADKNGELGNGTYGHSMIHWNSKRYSYENKILNIKTGVNQLTELVKNIKSKPDSRRHIITLWNPSLLNQQALPPCYHNFQFFVNTVNNTISMHVLQRSGDMFLGIPYDVNLFSLFLKFISIKTNYKADKIVLTIVDAHLYKNQYDTVNEYLKQKISQPPSFNFTVEPLLSLNVTDYVYHSLLTAEVAI